jgi:adenylate kinase
VEERNDMLLRKLQEQEQLRAKLEEKIKHLTRLILVSTSIEVSTPFSLLHSLFSLLCSLFFFFLFLLL